MSDDGDRRLRYAVLLLIVVCLSLGGCATLGTVTSGLFKGLVTLIKIPLNLLHVLADLLNKLPKPPPGVF